MKSFKQYVNEETMPYAGTSSGVIDVRESAVRDNINRLLAGSTNGKFLTPYNAFERVCKTLANFHIFPPRTTFLEGDSGAVNFSVNQFGFKMGMTDDGRVVTADDVPYHLYFEYRQSDCGMFEIFCEIVDQSELEEILDDLEDEMSGETENIEELDEATDPRDSRPQTYRPNDTTPYSRDRLATRMPSNPKDSKPKKAGRLLGLKSSIKDALGKHGPKGHLPEEAIDEVVTTRKMTTKEKKAHADYIVKHKEKLAANDTGIKAKKTFKDVNIQRGDYEKEPSKMKSMAAPPSGYYKVDEEKYSAKAGRAGEDLGKPGKNFAKIANKAGKEYGSAESGKKVAGAILAKMRAKHMEESTEEKKEKKSAKFKAYRDERDESKKKREDMKWQKHRLTKEGIDLSKIKLNKDTGNISSSDPKADLSKVRMDKKSGNISAINELTAKLVGKVNKARAVGGKPSKTPVADATRGRAVVKKWLDSDVGKLKE